MFCLRAKLFLCLLGLFCNVLHVVYYVLQRSSCTILCSATFFMQYIMYCNVLHVVYYVLQRSSCSIVCTATFFMHYIMYCNVLHVLYYVLQRSSCSISCIACELPDIKINYPGRKVLTGGNTV